MCNQIENDPYQLPIIINETFQELLDYLPLLRQNAREWKIPGLPRTMFGGVRGWSGVIPESQFISRNAPDTIHFANKIAPDIQ